ncbi:MAG: hypothetical protein FJ368_06525 [Pelagibacterales bacterium]|nr:hypothetical protein [Pelagibacterales bacterium]
MASPNFYNKNTTNIFAVAIENEFHYEDLKENLQNFFKRIGFHCIDESDNRRVFFGQYVAEKRVDFHNKEQSISLHMKPIIRCGYYSGVNLDFDFIISGQCDFTFFNDFVIEDYEDLATYKPARGFKTLLKKAKQALAQEVKAIEQIFANNSEALRVSAKFSNGETIYSRVNKT